jgi:predicted Zn finger-like uncharacterized protein
MRIACPSCAAEYEVPEARLTPHKMVRCVRCGGEWVPVWEAPEAVAYPAAAETAPDPPASASAETRAAPAPSLPAMTAMDRLAAASPIPPRSRTGLIGAWGLTFFVLGGAMAATVLWREEVIRVWPASSRILAPIGHILSQPGPTPGTKPK